MPGLRRWLPWTIALSGSCSPGEWHDERPLPDPADRLRYANVERWECFGEGLGCECFGLPASGSIDRQLPPVEECTPQWSCCSLSKSPTGTWFCSCAEHDFGCALEAGQRRDPDVPLSCPPTPDQDAACAVENEFCDAEYLEIENLTGCCQNTTCMLQDNGESICL